MNLKNCWEEKVNVIKAENGEEIRKIKPGLKASKQEIKANKILRNTKRMSLAELTKFAYETAPKLQKEAKELAERQEKNKKAALVKA